METTISKKDLPELTKLYKKAKKAKKESFIFKDAEVLVDYAKYVIEYFKTT